MKITSLVLKHSRVQIFIDEQYAFSCTQNFVVDNRLYKDLELDEKEVEALRKSAQYSVVEFKLFEYAMRGRYSERELRRKVTRYCFNKFEFKPEEDFFQKAIGKAIRLHLFDPLQSVRNLTQLYLGRAKSKSYIRSQLLSKGFSKSDIESIVDAVDVVRLQNNLKIILEKKYNSLIRNDKLDSYTLKQKLIQYGASKGYPFKDVKDTVLEILKSS